MMLAVANAAIQRALSEQLLGEDGFKIPPAAFFDRFPKDQITLWCHKHALYCLPTEELVEFLSKRIAGKRAIEIGSGAGFLGKALGIPCTDNWMQQDLPEVVSYYQMLGQPTIKYGEHVEKLDALEAVEKYKPDVVLGAWVTEYVSPVDKPGVGGGSVYGIKEEKILQETGEYIVVGHEGVHGFKKIMTEPHETFKFDWIKSRSIKPGNAIYIWRGAKGVDR